MISYDFPMILLQCLLVFSVSKRFGTARELRDSTQRDLAIANALNRTKAIVIQPGKMTDVFAVVVNY